MRRPSGPVALLVCCASFALLTSSCSRDPELQRREYLASGDKYLADKKYSEAIVQYRNAVVINPREGETRLKLGQAYAANGDSVNALREYIRSADLLPENIDAQFAAGMGLLAVRQYPEAQARAMAILEKDPKHVGALLLLGNSLAGLKDIDGAIAQVENAIDADPQRVLSYANLGSLRFAQGNATASEDAFKRAVDVAPTSSAAHLALANYYWASGARNKAESELKVALELDPKAPGANRALAVFYMQAGRAEEGERYLRGWAVVDSAAEPKLTLADFLVSRNRVPESRTLLESLLETKDGFAPAQRRLASLDFVTGKKKEVYDGLERILARNAKDEATLLQKGRFMMVDGNAAGALTQAEAVVKSAPRSAEGHFLNGIALKALRDLGRANAAFVEALRLKPTEAATLLQLAELSLAAGDTTSTLQYTDQVIKQRPVQGTAHLLRARALLQNGNLQALEPEFQALLKGSPNVVEVQTLAGDYYWVKKDVSRSRTAYERALTIRPGYLPALMGLVQADVYEKRPAAARTQIDAALTKTPNDEQLLLLAGKVYLATGDAARAEEAFRKVIQVNPASMQGYRTLATLYLRQRRLDDARRSFEEVAKGDSKDAVGASTMIGVILTAQGKPDEARRQYQRAIELDANAAVAANNLAWDYAEAGRDLDVALKLAQTAKAQLPDNSDVNDTMGWVYYKKDLASLAIASFQMAAKQEPTNASIRYRLGLAYAKNGDAAKARSAFTEALKLDPAFKEAPDAKRQLETLKS